MSYIVYLGVCRGTKKLGTKTGHPKTVKVQLELPKEASLDRNSIQIQEVGNSLNISFDVSSTERKEQIKMKPCSVRLERIQIPTEPELKMENVEELKCEDAPSVPEEKILESNEEDDMVDGI